MCEANVYMIDSEGKETLVLESVDKIVPTSENVILKSIFGEQKIIKAKIKEMTLVEHKIILEK